MSYFFIESKLNGLVLDIAYAEKGGKITTYGRHGGDNQLWQLSGGMLISKTGYVMDVKGASRSPGAQVIAWSKTGGDNQQWRIDGERIVSIVTGFCLDVRGGNMAPGTEVIVNKITGNSNQTFKIVYEQ